MSKKVYHEPMNDTELANILDMDEAEILGAFGYDNEGCVQNEGFNMFPSNQNEDENRMDMDGTQLISDTELAALNRYDANLVYDVIFVILRTVLVTTVLPSQACAGVL